jgi:UDP-3-O-[3-hydroxymyristoyl] glucosamine N-acyltransferase
MLDHPLIVLGSGPTAREIAETARLLGAWPAVQCLDPADRDQSPLSEADYILGMTAWDYRAEWLAWLASRPWQPASVIHPSAVVSASASVGAGSFLAAGVIVSAGARLDGHHLLHFHTIIGHDCVVGAHSCLNPRATLGGNVTLGTRCLVGAAAFVFQGVAVADDCQIDALSYIDRPLPPRTIASSRSTLRLLPRG